MASPGTQLRPLNVAIAGAGMISWHHLTAWRKLAPAVEVVAICDPHLTNARRRAAEFGIPATYEVPGAMFDQERIDAIDIASPRETHRAWIESAAARGIAVLCQKPLTPLLSEAEELGVRIGNRTRLMVHENWRFRPWYRQLKAWLEADDLGKILHGSMEAFSSGLLPDQSGRRRDLIRQPFMATEARLMIEEVLIHHLDVMRFLCGPLRVIAARASHTIDEVRGETLATIFLETAIGMPIVVTGTMAAPGFSPRGDDRLVIIGSQASARLSGSDLSLIGSDTRQKSYDSDQGYQQSFDDTIAHFVKCLRSGEPFETTLLDNLETLRLVEHAYWAAGLHGAAPARRGLS